jgi:hypothetical protein
LLRYNKHQHNFIESFLEISTNQSIQGADQPLHRQKSEKRIEDQTEKWIEDKATEQFTMISF